MAETSGRVAVVTGGGSGIGRAIARALASKGATVAVADLSEASAAAVATEIQQAGGRAIALACDVSDRAAVRAMQAQVERRLGAPSLLIANAGVTLFQGLIEMSDEDVDWIVQVNLLGVINCLQAFLPDMIEAREGHVLATASSSALLAPVVGHHAAYVATKAGVVGLMLSLRHQLRGFGVGATVLCPGGVSTQIFDSPRYRPARFGGPREASIKRPAAQGQQERVEFRSADEVAQMVLRAIRDDKAMVVTDPRQRPMFENGMVDLVRSAFDDAAQFDSLASPAA